MHRAVIGFEQLNEVRQVSVLAELAKRAPEPFEYLERWRELAPHDPQVHELLLSALAQRGRVREAEEHLAAACRSFETKVLVHRACARSGVRFGSKSAWSRSARAYPRPLRL